MKYLISGSAIIDISPRKGVALIGYPRYDRKNIGIHDPLFASSLYIDNGVNALLLISCDLCYFEKIFVSDIRNLISEKIGILKENIMLSASHTHSGPFTNSITPEIEKTFGLYYYSYPDYLEELKRKILKIAIDSYKNKTESFIGFGKGLAGKDQGIGGNRNDQEGLTDPFVGIMGVKDKSGALKTIWLKYSLHPTLLHADNLYVSADYVGYLRKYLKKCFPKTIMLFSQGASGDQSSRFFRKGQSFKEAERFGYKIGKVVNKVLETLKFSNNLILRSNSIYVMPELKSIQNINEAKENVYRIEDKLNKLKKAKADYSSIQTCSVDLLGAKFNLLYATYKDKKCEYSLIRSELPFEIQVMRIGSSCIVGIPGEIYTKYSIDIEEHSPFEQTFIATLTNGLIPGYVITKEAADKNTYEASSSLTKPNTGDLIVYESLKIINTLYEEK